MSTKAYREAVDYALELGLTDDGIDGTGHHRFRNAATGAYHSVSTTMPDRTRALLNTKASLRRLAGVDSRGREATEGERRQRRTLGRLTSGFSLDAAKREARARKSTPPRVTVDDLKREREAAYLQLIALTERTPEAEQLAARVVELDQRINGT